MEENNDMYPQNKRGGAAKNKTLKIIIPVVVVLIAIIVAVLLLTTGSNSGGGNTTQTTQDNTVDVTMSGTGDSSLRDMSIELFGSKITLGKTTVQDLFDDKWAKDPDTWANVDFDEQLEYKGKEFSGLELDKSGVEISISFKNITEAFTTIDKCTVTSVSISGLASVKSADLACLNRHIGFDDVDSFKQTLGGLVSEYGYYNKEYTYSTFRNFTVELEDGTFYFKYEIDNETKEITSFQMTATLSSDYSIE